tara:strand:- start:276 stop:698 length:423 start_codon:yes stop_codon:yes gene_type:complete
MDLKIHSTLVIPSKEIQWYFSRSSGAGGQNVNKINSRVEVVFDVNKSKVLTPFQKFRMHAQLKGKIVKGCIYISVQEKRSQYQNRQLALNKLASIVKDGLKPPAKTRIETKPTEASRRRRVESKKKRGEVKKNRQFKKEE